MAKSDGSVIIDTLLDTKGFGKGVTNMKSQFSSMSGAAKKMGVAIGAAFAVTALVNFGKMLLVDGMLLKNDTVTVAVAATVSLSILFIVMFAKVVGSMLPIAAEKLGLDPAVMASPMITTIVDCCALLIYFVIAGFALGL